MSYLHVKLKTPKTIPSWAVRTRLGQIRERPPSPPPQPPMGVTPSCMNVTCILPGAVHGVDSSELVSHPLHAPVGVTPSCRNVTYELCQLASTSPPPPSRRGELPVLYRGFVSHPQPPRRVSPFCIDVAYMLRLSPGAAHGVDSSELAFRLAAIGAMREGKGHHVRSQGHSK